jgi:dihydroorotate dehydrogenase (fumarate)
MDLNTEYLGLKLKSPLMPGASPLSRDLDDVKRLEDAGASAIVLHSLFEEQIIREQRTMQRHMEEPAESFSEAVTYFPNLPDFRLGPHEYLNHIRRVKEAVDVPVIASLNGSTVGGWIDYGKKMEDAGADAIELNLFFLGTDFEQTGEELDSRCIEIVRRVKKTVSLPVAIKIGPFYSCTANAVLRMEERGADGFVIFNRFYQPDIDVESLEVVPQLVLSTSAELRLRLRWLALLSPRITAFLAVTGGVHTVTDAVKSIMAGAHAVQLVSVLLLNGPEHLKVLKKEFLRWMESHEYASVNDMRATMNLATAPDPAALTRANYLEMLQY